MATGPTTAPASSPALPPPTPPAPPTPIRIYESHHRIALAWFFGIYAVTAFIVFVGIGPWLGTFGLLGMTVSNPAFALVILTLYLGLSIRVIDTEEIGGIMVLQKPSKAVEAGLAIVLLWFMELHKMPTGVQQVQFPAEPEQISKRPDEAGLLPGEMRPIRITTGPPKPGDTTNDNDVLTERLTVEVTVVVRWRVEHGTFFEVFVRIPGRNWPEKRHEIERQMRDTAETELIEEASGMTAGELVNNVSNVNKKLTTEVANCVLPWGVTVLEARMQSPDLSHQVSQKLAAIVTARAEAKATRVTADATRYKLEQEGQGRAAALQAELAAQGKGLKESADAMADGTKPRELLEAEVAKATIGEGDLIIGTDGIAQALGLAKGLLGRSDGNGKK